MTIRSLTAATPARTSERAGVALSFNQPKIDGRGEDADPLLVVDANGRVVVGVFDGLGGSGSIRCGGVDGVQSGAYYASRVVRDATGRVLRLAAPFSDVTPAALAQHLGAELDTELRAYYETWGKVGSTALRSALFRRLPTTAAIAVARCADNIAHTTVLWAGDSRCYILTPADGLQQLTRDHLRTPEDALSNLTSDALISNCISADAPAALDALELTIPLPAILVAATDGCFGYVPTPMHFEALVLDALQTASSLRGWKQALRTRIAAVAGDDASLAIVAIGWRRFRALKKAFAPRLRTVTSTFIKPLADAVDVAATRRQLWTRYAETYEAHLPQETA